MQFLNRRNAIRLGISFAIPALALLGFQNCSDVKFQEVEMSSEQLAAMSTSMKINNGAPFTNQTAVTVQIEVSGGEEMYITNDPTCKSGGIWEPFANERGWYLEFENQKVAIYGTFRRKKANGFDETTPCIMADIVHDGIPPETEFLKSPEAISRFANSKIEWRAEDKLSGLDHVECKADSGAVVNCDTSMDMNNLSEGVHRISVQAFDKAGNKTKPAALSWLVDSTPPVLQFTAMPPASSFLNTATFNFEAIDDGSGIDKIYCKVDSAAFAPCQSPFNQLALSEGTHTFMAYAVDKAGLSSVILLHNWSVNAIPPGAFSILGISGGTKDANIDQYLSGGLSPKVNWSQSNNAVKYDVAILNASGTATICAKATVNTLSYQFPSGCSLLDGATYTAVVTSYDSANHTTAAAPYKFIVDATGPLIIIANPISENVEQTEATAFFSIADAVSGVSSATCVHSYNGAQVPSSCTDLTQLKLINLLPGDHTFSISAVDNAGNISQSSDVQFTLEARTLEQYAISVEAPISKIDVLMVIDNSGSMDAERAAFGQKLKDFITKLEPLDWRVCITTTSPVNDGALREIYQLNKKSVYYLDKNTPDYEGKFLTKVKGDLGNTSGDEQGIYSTVRMVERIAATTNTDLQACLRSDAAFAAVVISDEDERSLGGYPENVGKSQYYDLTTKNYPQNALDIIRQKLGPSKSFIFHSLVIKYPDTDGCFAQSNNAGVAAYYGRRYQELSALTSGIVGSLCAPNYGVELAKMADQTVRTIDTINLRCSPVPGTLEVKVDTTSPPFTVSGNKIQFSPQLVAGTIVSLKYYCAH